MAVSRQSDRVICRSTAGLDLTIHPGMARQREQLHRFQPSMGQALLSLGLFVLAVLGTALWVRVPRPAPQDPLFLAPRTRIPGYGFQPVPLDASVTETLATTQLVNGHFIDGRSNRFSVFHASWEPGQGTGGNVFGHTPEICWVGAGFRTVRVGEPSQVSLKLLGRSIPFQCRVLRHPSLPIPEITLWAASLEGHWDDIVFGPPPGLLEESGTLLSHLKEFARTVSNRWTNIRRLVQRPFTQSARKQFIRFSKPLTTDWSAALTDLEHFAQAWLEAEATQASSDRSSPEGPRGPPHW